MHPTSLYLIVCLAYNDERTRLNNAANTAMYVLHAGYVHWFSAWRCRRNERKKTTQLLSRYERYLITYFLSVCVKVSMLCYLLCVYAFIVNVS